MAGLQLAWLVYCSSLPYSVRDYALGTPASRDRDDYINFLGSCVVASGNGARAGYEVGGDSFNTSDNLFSSRSVFSPYIKDKHFPFHVAVDVSDSKEGGYSCGPCNCSGKI